MTNKIDIQKNKADFIKNILKKATNTTALIFAIGFSCQITNATILFQNDDFATIESTGIILNSDNESSPSANMTIQFGSTIAETLSWDNSLTRFVFSDDIDISNNQAYNFRVENVVLPATMGNPGTGATGKIVQLTGSGTDSTSPGCTGPSCPPGTYSWNGAAWKSLQGTVTTSNATKIITVGPTGRDYTTIQDGATYCNTLSGCEMWIDPGNYPVTASVDLENIHLVGAGTGLTTISVTGTSGLLNVRQTTFDELTINVCSAVSANCTSGAISSSIGLNVKYNVLSNSSLRFNKVDFIPGTGKFILGSTELTPPVAIVNLQNCSESSGGGALVAAKISSGLNSTPLTGSTFTVVDLISTSALKLNDWPVTIVGGSNVVNTGNITTIPDRTILVSPGMSINNAIASLVASGGSGVVKLLVGTHTITAPIVINSSNIQLIGEGPGTIIDVPSAGWTGGTGATVAAIQVGAATGITPVSNVVVQNFKLQVAPDIHGIKVNGGTENKVIDTFVQSTGTKASTHTGIVFTDSTLAAGQRYTATRNIVNSSSGTNRWVDGIHFDGDAAIVGQLFGYGQGITDSIISENIVNEAQQTSYAFSKVSASGIFSNRARNIGYSSGSLGLFVNNATDVMVINNTIETNNNSTSNGISIYNNVQTSTFIGNAINNGGVTTFNAAIDLRDGTTPSNNNIIYGNQIQGATTGINIGTSNAQTNVAGNQFINTTNRIVDDGTNTKLETGHHRATANPTVNDDIADGYDVGTIWINTTTNNAFVLTDSTSGSALWSKINNDNPATDLNLVDDFIGGTNATADFGQLGWTFTNGAYTFINGVTNHPGIFTLSQNAVVARLRVGGSASDTGLSFSTADNYDMNFIVRPSGGSISNTIKRLGMMNNTSGNPPSSGIYFEYSTTAADTTWQCVTRSGGTQTRTNSTISVASGTWANLRIKKNGSDVDFYVDGTLRCTNTTNIPTTSVAPVIQQQDTTTTANNNIDIDLFSLNITGMTR